MPELDDIVQRVAISGQDDVISALGSIGHAGEDAFKNLAESFGKIGEIAAGITVGITGVGAALFEWAKHSSEAVIQLRNLSNQMGSTIEQASSLQGALISMGGSADGLANAFRRAAFNIAREWEQIKKSSRDAKDQLIDDANAVARAQLESDKATRARQAGLGQPVNFFDPAREKREELYLSESEAAQKAAEARKKQDEDRRKSLAVTMSAIESVTQGVKSLAQAGKDADLSTENIFRALVATATPETADAIKNFSGNISDLAGMTPKVRDFFYNLSDFMKNAHDSTIEQALAVRVFGRGVGQDLIYPLRQGSDAIKEHEEKLKSLGLVISDDALKPAEEFHHAYNSLTYDLSTSVKQIGLAFAPEFTAGMKTFTAFFENNHKVLTAWADDLAKNIQPVVEGFFNALSGAFASLTGAKVDPTTEIGKWTASFNEFGKTAKSVFAIVTEAASTFYRALTAVTEAINSLTGTHLNNLETLLGGLVLWRLTGTNLGGALVKGITGALAGVGGVIAAILGGGAAGAGAGAASGAAGLAGAGTAGAAGGSLLTRLLASLGLGGAYGTELAAFAAGGQLLSRTGPGLGRITPGQEGAGRIAKIATEHEIYTAEGAAARAAGRLSGAGVSGLEATGGGLLGTLTGFFTGTAFTAALGLAIGAGIEILAEKIVAAIKESSVKGHVSGGADGLQSTIDATNAGGFSIPLDKKIVAADKEREDERLYTERLGRSTGRLPQPGSTIVGETQESQNARVQYINSLQAPSQEKQATTLSNTDQNAILNKILQGDKTGQQIDVDAEIRSHLLNPLVDAGNAVTSFASKLNAFKGVPTPVGQPYDGFYSSDKAVGEGKAGGGPISGPGSGTSDSILTPTSKGEFVVKSDGSNLTDAIHYFARGSVLAGMVNESGVVGDQRFTRGDTASRLTNQPAQHFGTVDLRTDHGDIPVQMDVDVLHRLTDQAAQQRIVRGGTRQFWRDS